MRTSLVDCLYHSLSYLHNVRGLVTVDDDYLVLRKGPHEISTSTLRYIYTVFKLQVAHIASIISLIISLPTP